MDFLGLTYHKEDVLPFFDCTTTVPGADEEGVLHIPVDRLLLEVPLITTTSTSTSTDPHTYQGRILQTLQVPWVAEEPTSLAIHVRVWETSSDYHADTHDCSVTKSVVFCFTCEAENSAANAKDPVWFLQGNFGELGRAVLTTRGLKHKQAKQAWDSRQRAEEERRRVKREKQQEAERKREEKQQKEIAACEEREAARESARAKEKRLEYVEYWHERLVQKAKAGTHSFDIEERMWADKFGYEEWWGDVHLTAKRSQQLLAGTTKNPDPVPCSIDITQVDLSVMALLLVDGKIGTHVRYTTSQVVGKYMEVFQDTYHVFLSGTSKGGGGGKGGREEAG